MILCLILGRMKLFQFHLFLGWMRLRDFRLLCCCLRLRHFSRRLFLLTTLLAKRSLHLSCCRSNHAPSSPYWLILRDVVKSRIALGHDGLTMHGRINRIILRDTFRFFILSVVEYSVSELLLGEREDKTKKFICEDESRILCLNHILFSSYLLHMVRTPAYRRLRRRHLGKLPSARARIASFAQEDLTVSC